LNDDDIIVSLTSFPLRIDRLWITIESIFRQSVLPSKIILWLSSDQFKSIHDLPRNLLKMQDRGLEIKLKNGDIRSHKKYYYTLKQYPNSTFITIDDDIIYPSNMISTLIATSRKYPGKICTHRGYEIKMHKNDIAPYKEWVSLESEYGPASSLFLTSGGGTLFPPGSLHTEVFNIDVFTTLCLMADDIWLNVMIQLKGTEIVKTNRPSHFLQVMYLNNITLAESNVAGGENDIQISRLRRYYNGKYNRDPFYRIIPISKQ